jgi:ATP-binding cassette ChvD family protein
MASYQYAYVTKDLTKILPGGRQLFSDISISFFPGAKIGILGVNGTGKSTLMKIMAGLDTEFNGEAWAAEGITVGYLPQEPGLDPHLTVQENIMEGLRSIKVLRDEFEAISAKFAEPIDDEEMTVLLERQTQLQEQVDAADAWDLERRVDMAMQALHCPPGDESVTHLSGGEKRRVALCKLLLEKPDILLLDEPTNHLDAESVAWLQKHLQEYKGTVILVTHDRYFLDQVVGWILELDRGAGYPFEGNYSTWLETKQKRLEKEKKQDDNRAKVLARELEWVRSSAKARQSKSKARISAYNELLNASQRQEMRTGQIFIPAGDRLGSHVLEVKGLEKHFPNRTLINDLSFSLPPGGIVGVIGHNGAGKSTLFRMIVGALQPDAGVMKLGETVTLGYVDQSREGLDPLKTVWEEVSDGLDILELGKRQIPSRAYLGQFGFKGGDQQKKVGQLSGGERNRLHLAKLLKMGANVLLLDEPTNDLDIDTLRSLEDALLDFAGCAVVISHDRWFLDRVATHILAFEGNGHIEWFHGNYEAYEADKVRRS